MDTQPKTRMVSVWKWIVGVLIFFLFGIAFLVALQSGQWAALLLAMPAYPPVYIYYIWLRMRRYEEFTVGVYIRRRYRRLVLAFLCFPVYVILTMTFRIVVAPHIHYRAAEFARKLMDIGSVVVLCISLIAMVVTFIDLSKQLKHSAAFFPERWWVRGILPAYAVQVLVSFAGIIFTWLMLS